MPDRPSNPEEMPTYFQDWARRIRALERQRFQFPDGADTILQTFESGTPLGDTRFLDFGANLRATLIEDDYVQVDGVGGGELVFDALVDKTRGTSDPENRIFVGIGEACAYLKNTVGLTHSVVIAVRPDVFAPSSNGAYQETADWDSPENVRLFGLRGARFFSYTNEDDAFSWDIGNFHPTTSVNLLIENCHQFEVNKTSAGVGSDSTMFNQVHLVNTWLDCSNSHTAALFGQLNMFHCSCDFRTGGGTMRVAKYFAFWMQTRMTVRTAGTFVPVSETTGGILVWRDCQMQYGGGGGGSISLPQMSDIDLSDILPGPAGSSSIPPFTVPASADLFFTNRSPNFSGAPNITAASTFDRMELSGVFGDLTISGAHEYLKVEGWNSARHWDITGPAVIDVELHNTGRMTVRGQGVSGHIAGDALAGSSGTFLDFVNADYCNIHVGADPTGTSGTRKSYAFDGSSTDNGLWFDDTGWPVTGTDSGTGNLVLPRDIPSGGAAPVGADYLVGTANASLSAEIVVGTTPGGELGGTWASPTVDTTHSGSSHAGVVSTHEAAADPHTGYQKESEKDANGGYVGRDGSGNLLVPGQARATGGIGVGNSAAATTPGTVTKKIEVFDDTGASLGFIAIYDAIT